MIAAELKENELGINGLGGRSPPKDIKASLLALRGKLKAIWNQDTHEWEIYRTDTNPWKWQCTFPYREITPAIIPWLQKRDTSDHGKNSDEYRKKKFAEFFYGCRDRDKKAKETKIDNSGILLELSDRARFITDRSYMGVRRSTGVAGAKRILKPTEIVGYNKGIPIRAYKRGD